MVQYDSYKTSGASWLGDIPSGWDVRPLKHIFAIQKRIAGQQGYAVLSITQSGIKPKDMSSQGQFAEDYSNYQLVYPGDFAMNHMDLLTGWVDISKYEGVTSPDYRVFTNKNTADYLSDYYKYILQYCYSNKVFYGLGQGVAGFGRWRLPAEMFLNFKLPVPTKTEQSVIIRFLNDKVSHIDSIIAEARASIEEYKAWKASIIYEAVTKGLDPNVEMKESGIPWVGNIPKEWCVGQLGKYVSVFNGDRSSNYPTPEEITADGVPFFTSYDLNSDEVEIGENRKYISQEKYDSLSGYKAQIGDIIFCLRGSIGKCAINLKYSCGTVASSLMGIRCSTIYSKFAFYLLVSKVIGTQNDLLMNGTCAANLSAKNVCSYRIIVPPIKEQRDICAYLDQKATEIDGLICEKKLLIDELESYRKSLIFEVVTGKRKVC